MQCELRRQWWQQLGGMSQGMLFLEGQITHPAAARSVTGDERIGRSPVRDAASARRRERAIERLHARQLRHASVWSLFR